MRVYNYRKDSKVNRNQKNSFCRVEHCDLELGKKNPEALILKESMHIS
jgi:hypothetical protein